MNIWVLTVVLPPVHVQYVWDLRCGLSKLHNHYGQCFPLPVFAKTAPSSRERCQVKIQLQYLHTSLQTTSIIIISHSTVIYQQLHYLPIWTKIWVIGGIWDGCLSMQKLILHLEQAVWRCVCLLLIILPSRLQTTNIFRIEIKIFHRIIIENWSALRGTMYKKIGSIEFLIEMLMADVDTQNTIQHSSAPRGALIC